MTTTAPITWPSDVPLPPGAQWARLVAGDPDPDPYSVVYGAGRDVAGSKVSVQAIAVQYPDGSLDSAEDPPQVFLAVDSVGGAGLVSGEARELAAALLEAADQLDRWGA